MNFRFRAEGRGRRTETPPACSASTRTAIGSVSRTDVLPAGIGTARIVPFGTCHKDSSVHTWHQDSSTHTLCPYATHWHKDTVRPAVCLCQFGGARTVIA